MSTAQSARLGMLRPEIAVVHVHVLLVYMIHPSVHLPTALIVGHWHCFELTSTYSSKTPDAMAILTTRLKPASSMSQRRCSLGSSSGYFITNVTNLELRMKLLTPLPCSPGLTPVVFSLHATGTLDLKNPYLCCLLAACVAIKNNMLCALDHTTVFFYRPLRTPRCLYYPYVCLSYHLSASPVFVIGR